MHCIQKGHGSPHLTRATPTLTLLGECSVAAPPTPALLGLVRRVHQCTRSLVILSSLQHRWAGTEHGQLQRMRQHIDGDSVVAGVSIAAWKDRNVVY